VVKPHVVVGAKAKAEIKAEAEASNNSSIKIKRLGKTPGVFIDIFIGNTI
jgi:hypothetical protein